MLEFEDEGYGQVLVTGLEVGSKGYVLYYFDSLLITLILC